MDKEFKARIDQMLEDNESVLDLENLMIRIAADAEAVQYLKEKASEMDPGIDQYLVEEKRIAYSREQEEDYGDFIPASAMAADDGNNLCDLQCEEHILKQLGMEASTEELAKESRNNYWLRSEGTPLYNMGKLLEKKGLFVNRLFDADMQTLREALKTCKVIVVVNGDIIAGKEVDITADDFSLDDCPNHAVVVESVSEDGVTIFNPAEKGGRCSCGIRTFADAWSESRNYMVAVRRRTSRYEYNPQPIDVSGVRLNKELEELGEFLAENSHDVWGLAKKEKYVYGEHDDDTHNHYLMPYCDLPEADKQPDRDSVQSTLKVIKRLGFRLVNINSTYRCPECGESVELSYNFCPSCGRELTWEDFK